MKNIDELSTHYCLSPFRKIEISDDEVFTCCSIWMNEPIGYTNLSEIKDGEKLKNVRLSVLDGTFKYCNKNVCPYILSFIYDNKSDMIKKIKDPDKILKNSKITIANINIDNSCNLSCPICRKEVKKQTIMRYISVIKFGFVPLAYQWLLIQ